MPRWTKRHRFAILLALARACAVPAAQRRTDPAPILILISFDGWRAGYFDRVPSPNLHALAARGVRATGLIPSFPSGFFLNTRHRFRFLRCTCRGQSSQNLAGILQHHPVTVQLDDPVIQYPEEPPRTVMGAEPELARDSR